jgi:voltage-gated potassium channel
LVTHSTKSHGPDRVDVMASVDDLAAVPLFSSLDEEQLVKLANWFHVQNANEGARLVGEGAPGYTFFVLIEGTAAVTSEGQTLTELTPGDFFGEVAILGDGRRTATVTSTSPARLLVLFGTEFRQLEAADPEIASRIAEAMQARAGQIAELDARSA